MDTEAIAGDNIMARRCHTSPDLRLLDQHYHAAQSDWTSFLSGIQPMRTARLPRATPYAAARLQHRGPIRSASDLTQLAAGSASVDVGRFSVLASVDVDGSSLCAQLDLAEVLAEYDDANGMSAAPTRVNSASLLLTESPPRSEQVELLQKLEELDLLSARPRLAADER